MKTLRTLIVYTLAAIISLPLVLPRGVEAQAYGPALNAYISGSPVVRTKTAISTSTPIVLRYTGTSACGSVAVDAGTGDLTFTSGVCGSEAADVSFECPVSGALGGVIDVSDAACNTFGEVVDTINGTCTGCIRNNWTAVLVDAIRADTSVDALATLAATNTNTGPAGLGLLQDDAVVFNSTLALTQYRDLRGYVQDGTTGTGKYALRENPYVGLESVMFQTSQTNTFGSGTSLWQYLCVASSIGPSRASTETVTTYAAGATAATTVFNAKDFPYGFSCPVGQKLMSRVLNSAALTAITHGVFGRIWKPTP